MTKLVSKERYIDIISEYKSSANNINECSEKLVSILSDSVNDNNGIGNILNKECKEKSFIILRDLRLVIRDINSIVNILITDLNNNHYNN